MRHRTSARRGVSAVLRFLGCWAVFRPLVAQPPRRLDARTPKRLCCIQSCEGQAIVEVMTILHTFMWCASWMSWLFLMASATMRQSRPGRKRDGWMVGSIRDLSTLDSHCGGLSGRFYNRYQNTTLHTPLEHACFCTSVSMDRVSLQRNSLRLLVQPYLIRSMIFCTHTHDVSTESPQLN